MWWRRGGGYTWNSAFHLLNVFASVIKVVAIVAVTLIIVKYLPKIMEVIYP